MVTPVRGAGRAARAQVNRLERGVGTIWQLTTHPGTLAAKEGCIINLYWVTRIPEFRKSGISESVL